MSHLPLKSVRGFTLATLTALLMLLTACSNVKIEDYATNSPVLDIAEYFTGDLSAHGVIKNRLGKVTRYFNVDMNGLWDQNGRGTLTENFTYDDGETQQRIWVMTPDENGVYWASAGDVKKPAEMRIAGNTLFMNYALEIPFRGNSMDIAVIDRMYLTNGETLINESRLTKFGVTVGSILLVINKTPQP